MALSKNAKERLVIALTSRKVGAEVSAAIDASSAKVAAHVASVSAPNATDLASAETLANANKVTINAILAALEAAGLMS